MKKILLPLLIPMASLWAGKTAHRELQFENDIVRVWKTTIEPSQPLKMHRHDCPRIVVGLKGVFSGKLKNQGSALILFSKVGLPTG